MMMARAYFITSGLQGCYLVRCLLPLQENGWDGDKVSIMPGTISPLNQSKAAQAADIVVFHRPLEKEKLELAKILKGIGKKIVMDNDDTLKDDGGFRFNDYMDKQRVEEGMKTLSQAIDDFIGLADMVTVSTEFLATEYRKLHNNVVVLPNCIDPFMYDEPLRNEGEKVRIGFAGSVTITDDLNVLEPIIRYYENDPRVQLVLFGLPPDREDKLIRSLYEKEYEFWDSVQNLERHSFAPVETYIEELNELRLDTMIIPRADNYFNRCKSNIKFLECSMLEIPVIAQSFPDHNSPYEVNPGDRKHMALATDHKSWIEKIEFLIQEPNYRHDMAKRAHRYVLDNYSIEKNGHLWADAYETLV